MNTALFRNFFFLFLAVATVDSTNAAPQADFRTWNSANGKFSIEAKLQSKDGNTLLLEDTKGKTIKVPLDKLSKADREFVDKLGEDENPFEVVEGSTVPAKPWAPIKGAKVEIKWGSSWYPGHIIAVKGKNAFLIHYAKYSDDTWDEVVTRDRIREPLGTARGVGARSSSPDVGDSKDLVEDAGAEFSLTSVDVSAAREVTLGDPAWKMAKISKRKFADLGNVRIKIPTVPDGIHTGVFAMNRAQTKGFLAVQNGVKEKKPQLAAFDLAAGEFLGATELPIPYNHFRDVNADGSILLSSSGSWFPKRNRVDRWKIKSDGTLEHLGGIELKQKVSQAAFTFNGDVLVADSWGQASVWDMENAKPLFKMPRLGFSANMGLSQDKRVLFAAGGEKIYAVDLKKGICRCSIEHNASPGPLAVTNDYGRLAMSSKNRILVWDNEGEKLADFYVPGVHKHLQWIDDRFLTTGKNIIDTQSRIELCTLESLTWYAIDGRGDYWMFKPRTQRLGNAPAMMRQFKTLVPEDLESHFVLKEGDTIALDINVGMPAKDRDEVKANIERQLAKRGVTIDDQSEFRITMSETSKSETKEYREFGSRKTSSVTAQRTIRNMALVKGDMTLMSFGQSSGGAPSMIMRKENETLQQAATKDRGKRTYDFYKRFRLPEDIAIHPNNKPFAEATFDAFK